MYRNGHSSTGQKTSSYSAGVPKPKPFSVPRMLGSGSDQRVDASRQHKDSPSTGGHSDRSNSHNTSQRPASSWQPPAPQRAQVSNGPSWPSSSRSPMSVTMPDDFKDSVTHYEVNQKRAAALPAFKPSQAPPQLSPTSRRYAQKHEEDVANLARNEEREKERQRQRHEQKRRERNEGIFDSSMKAVAERARDAASSKFEAACREKKQSGPTESARAKLTEMAVAEMMLQEIDESRVADQADVEDGDGDDDLMLGRLDSSPGRSSRSQNQASPDIASRKSPRRRRSVSADEHLLQATQMPSRKRKLCPFCSAPLPEAPSRRLLDLHDYLLSRPHIVDNRSVRNPDGKRLPVTETATFCRMHEDEAHIVPDGVAQGWPTRIDWNSLPERIERTLKAHLTAVVLGEVNSEYLDDAKQTRDDKGAVGNNTVMSEFDTFEVEQPGYYGARGFEVMLSTLTRMFVSASEPLLTDERAAPLDTRGFIRQVLMPEAALHLIKADLELDTDDEAREVLVASRPYGRAMFPSGAGEEAAELSFVREEELREQDEARTRKELRRRQLEGQDKEGEPVKRKPRAVLEREMAQAKRDEEAEQLRRAAERKKREDEDARRLADEQKRRDGLEKDRRAMIESKAILDRLGMSSSSSRPASSGVVKPSSSSSSSSSSISQNTAKQMDVTKIFSDDVSDDDELAVVARPKSSSSIKPKPSLKASVQDMFNFSPQIDLSDSDDGKSDQSDAGDDDELPAEVETNLTALKELNPWGKKKSSAPAPPSAKKQKGKEKEKSSRKTKDKSTKSSTATTQKKLTIGKANKLELDLPAAKGQQSRKHKKTVVSSSPPPTSSSSSMKRKHKNLDSKADKKRSKTTEHGSGQGKRKEIVLSDSD